MYSITFKPNKNHSMKGTILCLLCFVCITFANAQIDSRKRSGRFIPAIVTPEVPEANKKIAPEEPEANVPSAATPEIEDELDVPEKTFSMFPQEQFVNPGQLYSKRLNKIEKTLLPEGHGLNAGLKEDAYWGDYHTQSNSIRILYRDHSAIDGDLLSVFVDGDILRSREYLITTYKGFKLDLKKGNNKIDFFAVNTGASGPNTAEYKILDENNTVIARRVWGLEAGVKVSITIVKD
jgi:hypothetical protein